jgi:hypothetical protein
MDRDVQRLITKDRSSGMIHLRLVVDGKSFTQEGCNLDDAGEYDVLDDLPADIDISMLCRNDFPMMHDKSKPE